MTEDIIVVIIHPYMRSVHDFHNFPVNSAWHESFLAPHFLGLFRSAADKRQFTLLLTEITEIRAKAVSGRMSDDEQVELDNKLSKMLSGIMVAVENYPDLKANQNFLQLQRAMNEIEEQISAARRAYNAAVTAYNNAVEMFPTNVAASMMRYKLKKVFEISEEQREDVDAEKLFKS